MSEARVILILQVFFLTTSLFPLWILLKPKSYYRCISKLIRPITDKVKKFCDTRGIKYQENKDTPLVLLALRITGFAMFIIFIYISFTIGF